MTTVREKLFGAESKCDAGDKCILGGTISQGDDCFVVWTTRGTYPFLLADIVSLDGLFEIYHVDCMEQIEKGGENGTDTRPTETKTG